MQRIRFVGFVLAVLLAVGCDKFQTPVSPSPTGSEAATVNLSAWRPCVGVQTPGSRGSRVFEVQMDAVRRLREAGKMQWIRLGGSFLDGTGRDYGMLAKSWGMNVFGIIHLHDLESGGSWESVFDRMVMTHPYVDYWEIAGEVSNTDPGVNPNGPTTPEIFMEKFKGLYSYVKQRYPNVTLVSPPTLGSRGGPSEFERFVQLGLLEMDLVIAVNIYTRSALESYSAVFDRYAGRMARRRIWVTETGVAPPQRQIDWVNDMYPRINRALRPEMICWYILYDGEHDNGNGMIGAVERPEPYYSDLFKALVGGPR